MRTLGSEPRASAVPPPSRENKCDREDSNLHALFGHSTSSCCVCHSATIACCGPRTRTEIRGLKNPVACLCCPQRKTDGSNAKGCPSHRLAIGPQLHAGFIFQERKVAGSNSRARARHQFSRLVDVHRRYLPWRRVIESNDRDCSRLAVFKAALAPCQAPSEEGRGFEPQRASSPIRTPAGAAPRAVFLPCDAGTPTSRSQPTACIVLYPCRYGIQSSGTCLGNARMPVTGSSVGCRG